MSTPTPSPRPQALNTPQLGKRTFLQELVGMATAFGLAGAGHAASPSATTQPPRRPGMEGKRFGMLVDRFGVPWMINVVKQQQPTE